MTAEGSMAETHSVHQEGTHDGAPYGRGGARAILRSPGMFVVSGALITAFLSLFILLGLTPIKPTGKVVIALVATNSLFVLAMVFLIGREVSHLLKARRRGRAAAQLHIRIVALFSIVAITPAILVAIFATLTLNAGLDRWFALRTQSIVQILAQCGAGLYDGKRELSAGPDGSPWATIWSETARSICSTAGVSPT